MRDQQEPLQRREWFVRLGRRAMLGAIGTLSAIFVVRRVNGECINTNSPCLACRLKEECRLPRAEETRRASGVTKR